MEGKMTRETEAYSYRAEERVGGREETRKGEGRMVWERQSHSIIYKPPQNGQRYVVLVTLTFDLKTGTRVARELGKLCLNSTQLNFIKT